jgi:hypothetical protein
MPGNLQNTNFSFLLPLFGSAFHSPPPKFSFYLSLSLSVSHSQHYLVYRQKCYIFYIVHVTCFMYTQYILDLCQHRLSTADHAKIYATTATLTVVRLTAAKFKPLMFSVSGFVLPYIADFQLTNRILLITSRHGKHRKHRCSGAVQLSRCPRDRFSLNAQQRVYMPQYDSVQSPKFQLPYVIVLSTCTLCDGPIPI